MLRKSVVQSSSKLCVVRSGKTLKICAADVFVRDQGWKRDALRHNALHDHGDA
jgi:hypothetical protein